MAESIAAIVLAADCSTRMGDFKPLLPLGDKTALERTCELFQRAGVNQLQVVIGHRADELQPLLERLGVDYLVNDRYRQGMFTSVQCALANLASSTDAFFLQPVDMPLVRERTLPQLLRARQESGLGIIHPVFFGKRGHPPLISTRYRQTILAGDGEGGLKALLLPFSDDILEIEVADEHTVLDMDTPADYDYLCHRWRNYQLSSPRECAHLMIHEFSCDQGIIDHCRQVAQVADVLAAAVNASGGDLDRELLQAAALLHDCQRSQPNHAAAGAAALTRLDFPQVGALIKHHMDLMPQPNPDLSATEILYLADKLTAGDRCVTLEERFAPRLKRFAGQVGPLTAMRRRLSAARQIQHKVEQMTGAPLAQLLNPLQSSAVKG
jgi:putative nucleotidyltransferase with HDIG domain